MNQGKKMNKKLKKLLYRSFDGGLSHREKDMLDKALAESAELRREQEEIDRQRLALSQGREVSFGPMFAEQVVDRLSSPQPHENGMEALYLAFKSMFTKVAVVGVALALVLLSYNLTIGDQVTEEEAFFASDTTYEELSRLPLFY
jgi:hypothetical protein